MGYRSRRRRKKRNEVQRWDMEFEEFRRNFPSRDTVPERLVQLLEFQNRSRDWYSGDFELVSWPFGYAVWFAGDCKAAEQFAVFGKGGDGSLYAFWLLPGRTPTEAPVVFLGSEGTDCGVLAGNLDEFLGLLALGATDLGFKASWGSLVSPSVSTPHEMEFRDWLKRSFRITAPIDPMGVITAARKSHPEFETWLQKWQDKHG
jgi:hypothetical protein